jgi:alpha-tubulin suppressor-like RCC1 family protein
LKWKIIKDVSCNNHTIILTDEDRLYSCGENTFGQLCLGHEREQTMFQLVNSNKNILFSTTGGNYTAVITRDNNLYTCGQNSFGQLGLGDTSHRNLLQLVPLEKVTHVSCGFGHTMVIVAHSKLYAMGLNHFGQLGLGHSVDQYTPQLVTLPRNREIKRVFCGYHHTIFETKDHDLFGVGSNEYRQIGVGSDEERFQTFVKVKPKSIDLIRTITCHLTNATGLITTKSLLYCAGKNDEGQLCLQNTLDSYTFQRVNYESLSNSEDKSLLLID